MLIQFDTANELHLVSGIQEQMSVVNLQCNTQAGTNESTLRILILICHACILRVSQVGRARNTSYGAARDEIIYLNAFLFVRATATTLTLVLFFSFSEN